MLKTISAALVAVSVLAAPALAAAPGKTTQTPAIKAPVTRTVQAPVVKADASKSKLLNANAHMGRHHRHHRHHVRHHRHHKHMGVLKTHAAPKFVVKHVTSAPKRG